MATLLIGVFSGVICAVISMFIGASGLTVLFVYTCTGVIAMISHAVFIGLIEPIIIKRRQLQQQHDDNERSRQDT